MIEDLKPYPGYKESGLPWLSNVPEHWDLVPNRGLVKKRKVIVGKRHKDYQLLSLTKQGVIVRDISTGKGKFSSDMGTSQEVRVGDFVFCLFDVPETPRAVGLSRHAGMITGAYTVLEYLKRGNPDYFEKYYLAMDDRKLLSPLYSGLRHTIPIDRLLGAKTPQPPPDEQAAIVRFLDHANGKIDRAIRAKRKLIALLDEQKQAIIHRAATRGLDPNIKLKPSGIPWLGDVPEHWKLRRNSFLFDERNERGRVGLPILVVSLRTGVTEGNDTDEDGREKRLIADVTKYKFADKGDIAYNMMRMWQGAVGVVPVPGMVSPAYVVAKPRPGVLSAYYDHLFHTDDCKNEVNRHSRGIVTDRNRLYWDQFKRLFFPLPPYAEQQMITNWIESETSTLNSAVARTEREIALLREYRTTLTAEVVTGKLDVREAAKRLPAESEAPLPVDDLAGDEIDDEVPEEIEA